MLNSNPIISSVIIPEYRTFQITTQSLVRLFHYALRSRHEEILAWYNYSDNFENRVIEICHELGVTDKTARTQLYKEMLENLPGITSGNLRMKTLRAKKIRMLFGENGVGIDKIKQVTYSIYAISTLTNSQIQNVIKNVTSAKPLSETSMNRENQTSAEISIPTESQVSDPSDSKPSQDNNQDLEISEIQVSIPTEYISTDSEKILETGLSASSIFASQSYDRTHFRNKTLDQYPTLYREFSSENFDYYAVTDETSCGRACPLCELEHDNEESIEGRYKAGSYFIKCEQREIKIVA